ncbi:MAG TPA: hypothetical protein VM367_01880 [Pseudonocardia sp.]|nr:hypothetical protein [Pseudonocardia sp.]
MLVLVLASTVLGAALYLAVCRVAPYGRCRRCRGLGRDRTRAGRTRRNCRRCEGTGRALRVGARVWERLRR